MEERRLYCSAK